MIILTKNRRDFLRLSAGSLAGAASLAVLPALAAENDKTNAVGAKATRESRGRFKSVDDSLAQGVATGTVAAAISSAQKCRTATTYVRQPDGSLKPMPFEMNQRPEFFSGGGGLFGTPRDYIAFLQMLVKDGAHNGARVLKPETVALMRTNAIGDLNVNPLKSSAAMWSNDANLFPGMEQKWGLSFDINPKPGPNGRSAGSYAWAGLLNCYYWVDPVKKVTGALFTQLLPFYDARVVELFGAFERGVYSGLARA